MENLETITLNNTEYVKAGSIPQKANDSTEGLELVMIRSYGAGVFYGYLADKKAELNGINVVMRRCKRIHWWKDACSLTQLAIDGTTNKETRITDPLPHYHIIANVIEIIPMTKKAFENLEGIPVWKTK